MHPPSSPGLASRAFLKKAAEDVASISWLCAEAKAALEMPWAAYPVATARRLLAMFERLLHVIEGLGGPPPAELRFSRAELEQLQKVASFMRDVSQKIRQPLTDASINTRVQAPSMDEASKKLGEVAAALPDVCSAGQRLGEECAKVFCPQSRFKFLRGFLGRFLERVIFKVLMWLLIGIGGIFIVRCTPWAKYLPSHFQPREGVEKSGEK